MPEDDGKRRKSELQWPVFQSKQFQDHAPTAAKADPDLCGGSQQKMVSLASELADGVLLYLRPLDELKRTVDELKQITNGRNFEIAASFICALSDEEPEKARERAAKTLAFYVAVGKYYSRFLSENGFRSEVEAIISAYGKDGASSAAKLVPDRMLDSLAICGSGEECRKSLVRFMSAGVTLPIIQLNPVGDSESSFREMLSTF